MSLLWNYSPTPAECAGSGRLVGAFLSVCALTVLCGLVVVAMFRLVLQKRSRSAGGAHEDRDFHCTGKVRSLIFLYKKRKRNRKGYMETLISCRVPGALGIFIADVQPSSEKAALRNPSPAAAVFYISSPLPAHSQLCPNL